MDVEERSPCCEEMRDFLMTRGASTDFYRHPPPPNVIWQITHLWLGIATAPDPHESVQSWQDQFVELQADKYIDFDRIAKSPSYGTRHVSPERPNADVLGPIFRLNQWKFVLTTEPRLPSPRFGAVRQVYLNTHDAYPLLSRSTIYNDNNQWHWTNLIEGGNYIF